MKERGIVHESVKAWVFRDIKHGRYTVFRTGVVCSTSDSAYPLTDDGLSLARVRPRVLSEPAPGI